ncbi:hypothetical protein [Paracoccus halophilus]|nr:hypothetical protein [Paracoccus halophilus]
MTNWLQTFLGRPVSDPESERERQNLWISQKLAAWQTAWHDAFDRDPGADPRPDPLPAEIDSDYRLIFGLSATGTDTRKACFALFPGGTEMHRRLDHYLTAPAPILSAREAQDMVARIADTIDRTKPNDQIDWSRVEVIAREAPDADYRLAMTTGLSYLFERDLLLPSPERELPAIAARIFLTEPLYAAAGNSWELCDWVTGAMFDRHQDRIHELAFRLWHAGWRLRLPENGVILVREARARP